MSAKELNVAVVGAGYWGKNLVRNFAAISRSRLVTVCDSSTEVLDRMKGTYPGIRVTTDLDQVLGDDEVHAVALVTPAVMHAEQSLKALEAGKHVYVEKPMSLNVADALKVHEAVQRSGRTFMVGHMLVYHPVVARIKEMIRDGDLGDIFYMYALRVNLGRLRSDENALWSLGPHDVSVILHLLEDEPESVAARGHCYLQSDIEDVTFVNMAFGSGVMAQIQLSWLDPRKERKLTIVGSRKMLEFDDAHPSEKLRIFDKGYERPPEFSSFGEYLSIRQGDVLIPRVNMTEPLRVELEHFVESALEGRTPLTNAQSGLQITRVLEAATRSLENGGRPVEIRSLG